MPPVVGIFAHPDDEAMGPAGTLAILAQSRDVYLICATSTEERRNELLKSAKILGVKQVFFLDFTDGDLSNNLYHQLAGKIKTILDTIKPDTLLTYEPRGVSGHIDHITVSMVCSYLFSRLKYIKKIMFYCRNQKSVIPPNYFIYFPPGYPDDQIDEIVDIKTVFNQKISAIRCHKSQSRDVIRVISLLLLTPKKESFLVRSK